LPIVDKKKRSWRKELARDKKRRTKSTRKLKDPESTGRKRAAKLYPLDKDAPCEWQGLDPWDVQEVSGSRLPFGPCEDGKQLNRHHGPDKNPLNNEKGNVHRICTRDHNLWHMLNDEDYDWSGRTSD